MRIVIGVSKIDYSAAAERTISLLLAKKDEKRGEQETKKANSKSLAGSAAALALKFIPQDTKDEVAIRLLGEFEQDALNLINTFIEGKALPLYAQSFTAQKNKHVELSIDFGDVDYALLLMSVAPMIMDQLSKNEKLRRLIEVLNQINLVTERLTNAMMGALTKAELDAIVIGLVSAYEHDILAIITELAQEQGLGIVFASFDVEAGDVIPS